MTRTDVWNRMWPWGVRNAVAGVSNVATGVRNVASGARDVRRSSQAVPVVGSTRSAVCALSRAGLSRTGLDTVRCVRSQPYRTRLHRAWLQRVRLHSARRRQRRGTMLHQPAASGPSWTTPQGRSAVPPTVRSDRHRRVDACADAPAAPAPSRRRCPGASTSRLAPPR